MILDNVEMNMQRDCEVKQQLSQNMRRKKQSCTRTFGALKINNYVME